MNRSRSSTSDQILPSFAAGIAAVLVLGAPASASGWSVVAGDSSRSGLALDVGPSSGNVLWTSPSSSGFGSPAFVEGNRAFRVGNFQSSSSPATVECFDIDTGALAWSAQVPLGTLLRGRGSCLGVDHGRVYVTRGQHVYALDSTTGAVLWESALFFVSSELVGAHALPSMSGAFAPDGDLILDGVESIFRIRATDGSTLWETLRPAAGTGGQGVAVHGGSVYAHLSWSSGNEIERLDLTTGSLLYLSGPLSNSPTAVPPFVGADAVIHAAYSVFVVGSPSTLVSLRDNGTAFVPQWSVTTAATSIAGYATGPDGSVIHVGVATGNTFELQRLDSTGSVLANSAPIPYSGPEDMDHLAVDAAGCVFLTTHVGVTGARLSAFDPNLALLWSANVAGNIAGGPTFGRDGTLVLASPGNVTAFRTPRARGRSFCFGDGSGAACPCASGYPGNGCPDSAFASGARLCFDGVASSSSDTFVLRGLALPAGPCLFFQGSSPAAPGLGVGFGEGLLCVGGSVVRLAVEASAQGVSAYPGAGEPPVSVAGLVPAASSTTRSYQVWFRDAATFCGAATFNLSNAVEVLWSP